MSAPPQPLPLMCSSDEVHLLSWHRAWMRASPRAPCPPCAQPNQCVHLLLVSWMLLAPDRFSDLDYDRPVLIFVWPSGPARGDGGGRRQRHHRSVHRSRGHGHGRGRGCCLPGCFHCAAWGPATPGMICLVRQNHAAGSRQPAASGQWQHLSILLLLAVLKAMLEWLQLQVPAAVSQ